MLRRWRIGIGGKDPAGSAGSVAGNGDADGGGYYGFAGKIAAAVLMLLISVSVCSLGVCEATVAERLIESLDISGISKIGDESGIDVQRLLTSLVAGNEDGLSSNINIICESAGEYFAANILKILSALAVPVSTSIPVKVLLTRKQEEFGIFGLICRIYCIAVICTSFIELIAIAGEITELAGQCAHNITPVIVSAYALSGEEHAGAAVSVMSAIASGMIQDGIGKWGRGLALAAMGISVAGNLSGKISLKRLHAMICELFQWGLGLVMVGYMGALSLHGKLAAVQDSAGIRTARYAIESVIPVIGGNVSDSLGSLFAVVGLVRSALGVVGVVLIATAALLPLVRMVGILVALKIASAVCEPLGDTSMAAMLGQSADAARILLVASMSACLICALLSGSCIAVFNIAK